MTLIQKRFNEAQSATGFVCSWNHEPDGHVHTKKPLNPNLRYGSVTYSWFINPMEADGVNFGAVIINSGTNSENLREILDCWVGISTLLVSEITQFTESHFPILPIFLVVDLFWTCVYKRKFAPDGWMDGKHCLRSYSNNDIPWHQCILWSEKSPISLSFSLKRKK